MDDAVDGPIAVRIVLYHVQGTIPITVPLIDFAGSGAIHFDEVDPATRLIVVPLVWPSITVGIECDLLQLTTLERMPLFRLPIAIGVDLGAQQRFPWAVEQPLLQVPVAIAVNFDPFH